jgi:hypothetical protein
MHLRKLFKIKKLISVFTVEAQPPHHPSKTHQTAEKMQQIKHAIIKSSLRKRLKMFAEKVLK